LRDGWLSKIGALDFAGGMVVHVSSGFAALALAFVIGRRMGYSSCTWNNYDMCSKSSVMSCPFVEENLTADRHSNS